MNLKFPQWQATVIPAVLFLIAGGSAKAQQGSWAQVASFGGGLRSSAVAFTIGTKGYVGTGESTGGSYKKDFWEYDATLDAWSQKADFGGTPRRFAVGFSIGTKGYLGTGTATDGRKKDFWEYDQAANMWTQKADCGGPVRVYGVGFSIAGKGYAGTGFNLYDQDTKDIWEYDPATNAWTQKADFGGTKRDGSVAFTIDGIGYVGTGYDSLSVTDDFWAFDPVANTWEQKADFAGGARFNTCAFSIDGKGYVGTGAGQANVLKDDFWQYDPATDTWTPMADFGGSARQRSAAFAIGVLGYAGIGHSGAYQSDFWAYTGPAGIACNPETGPYCTLDSVHLNVPFTTSGLFNADNVFTAQLSNAAGSFASPVAIGNWSGTTSGTIACAIPPGTPAGMAYRIRVVSSDPPITGGSSVTMLVLDDGPPDEPVITAGGPLHFCQGDSVVLSADIPQYQTAQWYRDGMLLQDETGATLVADITGSYTVRLTNVCGTTGSISTVVTVDPVPVAQISVSGSASFCAGDSVVLDATVPDPQASYAWFADSIAVGADAATLVVDSSGSYFVVVTGGNGCTSTPSGPIVTTEFAVPVAPEITLGSDTLYASGSGSFQWYLADSLLQGATEAFLIPQANGNYTVMLTDSNGCSSISLPYTYLNTGIPWAGFQTLRVAPNPSSGSFTIWLPSTPENGTRYMLFNAAGTLVEQGRVINAQQNLDITTLPAGLYVLKVVATNATWTARLVKQ